MKPSDLRISPLFHDLTDKELETVIAVSATKTFPAKTLIIQQDSPSDYFYTLLSGSVRVFRTPPNSTPIELARLNAGSFFGEMAILDGSPRSVSVATLTPSKLLMISRENFLAEVEKVPHLALKLLRGMSTRIRKTDEKFITELQQRNETLEKLVQELKKVDEMKTKFFHLTSHELRTPLGIILMGLSLLEKELAVQSSENCKVVFDTLNRQILRLSESITSILKASEAPEGLPEEPKRKTDLNREIQRATDDLNQFFQFRNLKVTLKLDQKLKEIELYRDKFYQVILTLMMNAIRFTPDGGKVEVQTLRKRGPSKSADRQVLFSVTDTGIGIAQKYWQDIFKPFYVIEDTMKHTSGTYQFLSGGLGLGLTIAKKFTELHGGKIEVKSEVGKGSTFTVILPLQQP